LEDGDAYVSGAGGVRKAENANDAEGLDMRHQYPAFSSSTNSARWGISHNLLGLSFLRRQPSEFL